MMFRNYKVIKQVINGKRYILYVAKTDAQKRKGLSNIKKIPKNVGMIFPYQEEKKERTFTMKNVSFPLRIIFLDKKMEIVHQVKAMPGQYSIVCEKPSQYVIEILA